MANCMLLGLASCLAEVGHGRRMVDRGGRVSHVMVGHVVRGHRVHRGL